MSLSSSGVCAAESLGLIAVVGASLGGLAAANALVRLGYTVHVYERAHSSFHNKGLGMGFVDVTLWERLRGTRMMRRGKRANRAQGAFYYGDLWKFLFDGLPKGTVRFGSNISTLGASDTAAMLRPTIGKEKYDVAILADGGWSALRRYITPARPQYGGYVIWGGLVDAKNVPGFRAFGIWKNGIYDLIALRLATDSGRDAIISGIFVATPEAEVKTSAEGTARHVDQTDGKGETTQKHAAPLWFLPFVQEKFGKYADGDLVRLFKAVITAGKLTGRPQYEFGADTVTAGRIIMVGDAAHMASPRTASGAHTAVLDAMGLREAFATTAAARDIDGAIARYGPGGTKRARELNALSRRVGRAFLPSSGISGVISPSKLISPKLYGRKK